MTQQHTPGPWSIEYKPAKVHAVRIKAGGRTVADVRFKNGNNDAHLIAAAPETYNALASGLLEYITARTTRALANAIVLNGVSLPMNVGFPKWVRDGVAAIAKAKGKS